MAKIEIVGKKKYLNYLIHHLHEEHPNTRRHSWLKR